MVVSIVIQILVSYDTKDPTGLKRYVSHCVSQSGGIVVRVRYHALSRYYPDTSMTSDTTYQLKLIKELVNMLTSVNLIST
jgi:hypothetical protein